MRGVRGSGSLCSVADCERPHRRNGLCDMHDQRKKRTGTTDDPVRLTPEDRFWSKVVRRNPNECWLWGAAVNEHGYGVFNPDGRHSGPTVKAHRFSLALAGIDVGDLLVRHSCDNPPCVNPAHLSVGTNADNSADMVSRDRHARGSRSGTSKLTESQVVGIRRRAAAGELHRALAVDYGVSRTTITQIVNGKTWRHISGEDIDRHTQPDLAVAA